jgi:hypothetical protein
VLHTDKSYCATPRTASPAKGPRDRAAQRTFALLIACGARADVGSWRTKGKSCRIGGWHVHVQQAATGKAGAILELWHVSDLTSPHSSASRLRLRHADHHSNLRTHSARCMSSVKHAAVLSRTREGNPRWQLVNVIHRIHNPSMRLRGRATYTSPSKVRCKSLISEAGCLACKVVCCE